MTILFKILKFFLFLKWNIQFKNCKSDFDCKIMNICKNNKCQHKDFFPPNYEELIGGVLIFIGSALSNAGGSGGNKKVLYTSL